MIEQLRSLEREGSPIRVAVNGAGAMGLGVAAAVRRTPGMTLRWATDLLPDRARRAAAAGASAHWGTDARALLAAHPVDVLVEASTAIVDATRVALKALECGAHVVWMNAEADLVFGRLVDATARSAGLIATSDAGDQHGVLARLLDEIALWGWQIVQAGNIKGFLDRAATPQGLAAEAAKRRLDPRACCAYTDGTKLSIEMALIANARGLQAPTGGMRGPKAGHVKEALSLFNLDAARRRPEVDYLLGAEPGGGVYAIGAMDDPDERFMLDYYKLGPGPYYLHYRPCHLCHVETPLAIATAALGGRALLRPDAPLNEVVAVAKRNLPAGYRLVHGIGSPDLRGELLCAPEAAEALPIGLVHDEPGGILRRPIRCGEIIRRDAVTLLNDDLLALLDRQGAL
jgi:predicted homoserine dehydrogenase-like protein